MDVNNLQLQNKVAFTAQLKVKHRNTFKPVSEWYPEWLAEQVQKWTYKAANIGTTNDTITITLGKNGIRSGDRYSNSFKKQHLSMSAKINGVNIKDNNLEYEYFSPADNTYYERLNDHVEDWLDFTKRFARCKLK